MIEETRLGKPLWPEEAVNSEHVMGGRSYHGCHEFVHTSGTLASTKLPVTLQWIGLSQENCSSNI